MPSILVFLLAVSLFSVNSVFAQVTQSHPPAPNLVDIPQAAAEALAKSQDQLLILVPLLTGQTEPHQGSAFLVNKEKKLIISAFHVLPKQLDIFKATTSRASFRGMPLKLEYPDVDADVVLFSIEVPELPRGLEPVRFAKDAPPGSLVYTNLRGMFGGGGGPMISYSKAYSVGIVRENNQVFINTPIGPQPTHLEYVLVEGAVMGGFSGGMAVNQNGEVVGMSVAIKGGFTILVSAKTLQKVLADNDRMDAEIEAAGKK